MGKDDIRRRSNTYWYIDLRNFTNPAFPRILDRFLRSFEIFRKNHFNLFNISKHLTSIIFTDTVACKNHASRGMNENSIYDELYRWYGLISQLARATVQSSCRRHSTHKSRFFYQISRSRDFNTTIIRETWLSKEKWIKTYIIS